MKKIVCCSAVLCFFLLAFSLLRLFLQIDPIELNLRLLTALFLVSVLTGVFAALLGRNTGWYCCLAPIVLGLLLKFLLQDTIVLALSMLSFTLIYCGTCVTLLVVSLRNRAGLTKEQRRDPLIPAAVRRQWLFFLVPLVLFAVLLCVTFLLPEKNRYIMACVSCLGFLAAYFICVRVYSRQLTAQQKELHALLPQKPDVFIDRYSRLWNYRLNQNEKAVSHYNLSVAYAVDNDMPRAVAEMAQVDPLALNPKKRPLFLLDHALFRFYNGEAEAAVKLLEDNRACLDRGRQDPENAIRYALTDILKTALRGELEQAAGELRRCRERWTDESLRGEYEFFEAYLSRRKEELQGGDAAPDGEAPSAPVDTDP